LKKIKLLLAINFIMFFLQNTYGQSRKYLDDKYVADSLYNSKQFNSAVKYYKKCIGDSSSKRIDFYYLACSLSQISEEDSAIHYFKIALNKGLRYNSLEQIDSDPNTIIFRTYESWGKIRMKIKENTEVYMHNGASNEEIKQELILRVERDQKYRKIDLEKMYVNDKSKIDSLWKIQKKIDLDNQTWLREIIIKNGWPGISLVGEKGDNAAWLIVQHSDNDVPFQEYCLKYLIKAASENETNTSNVAYLTDRILINNGYKQKYGTQFSLIRDNDNKAINLEFKPIEDSIYVDRYRKYIGLPSLQRYKEGALKYYQKEVINK